MLMKTFLFYYDVVCPYAYLASTQVEKVAQKCNAKVIFTPVLLGGIYKETQAPQGKDGSATDVMSSTKKISISNDLKLQLKRHQVSMKTPKRWPMRTIHAQRLLVGVSDEIRPKLTHKLYSSLWIEGKDLEDIEELSLIAESFGIKNAKEIITNPEVKLKLEENTSQASSRGAIGVPSFWVNEKLIWGSDRLHFVEYELGNKMAKQLRVQHQPKLTFYFDFASPYSYLAWTQIERIKLETNAELEYVPILVGALFKKIGNSLKIKL
jgi:2-hydroxychromene-2-carboxylate isomerase